MTAAILIVGAGEAGTRAALGLRDLGYDGDITLIGDEALPPYERPPLSKELLSQPTPPGPVEIVSRETLDARNITYRAGVRATRIERAPSRFLHLNTGEALPYGKLLLATGAVARRLALPALDQIQYLRTFDDLQRLRPYLQPQRHCVIIGGGFIGLECAAAAIGHGARVTLIEAAPRLLTRAVPESLAARIQACHQAAGVSFRLDSALDGVEPVEPVGPGAPVEPGAPGADGVRLTLTTGEQIIAHCVIIGVGVTPNVALAEQAGLTTAGELPVNGQLATRDPTIFAAGDCATFPHPLYGDKMIRLESWRNAVDQGGFAARALLGEPAAFNAIPWFWSDQYALHLEIAGLIAPGDRLIQRKFNTGSTIDCYLDQDGRLTAACALGALADVARDMRLLERLIARRATPEPGLLADPTVRLKTLLV